MKKLIIAEKPSLAMNVVKALGKFKKNDGYFENNKYIVSFAFGHLFEAKDVKDYVEVQSWDEIELPFVPRFSFKIKDDSGVQKQFKILEKLIERNDVDEIVNCGDADREGQLIEDVYPIVFMDAIHYSVRKDGVVVKKAVYLAIGIDKEGRKEVLGFWIGENESSKYWLNVLNELKNGGVQDILIMSVDNLKGFSEAISSVFPKTEIQKCVVHQIRNSIKYISYKDVRKFTTDLKEMYNAPTLEQAEFKLDELEEKWGKKYMAVINSWRSN